MMCPGLLRSGRLASRCWSGLSLALLLGPRARQVAADLPLQRRYVPLSRWSPGVRRAACCLPALLPLLHGLLFFFAAGSAPAAARAAPPSVSVAVPVGVAAPSCSFPAHDARFVLLRGASVVVAHLRPSSACATAPPISSCSGCRDALCACRGLASGDGGSDSGVAGDSSKSLSDGDFSGLISKRPAGVWWWGGPRD